MYRVCWAIYCSPPLLTVALSHAMGAGLYCVRFYTHNLWNVIVLYKPLWEQEVFLKVIFSANYASIALLMNN